LEPEQSVRKLTWGERTHDESESRGLPMQNLEQFVACAEVLENTDSCRFFQVIGQNHKSLKNKQIFGSEGGLEDRKRGGPLKMKVYLTMYKKTKGKINPFRGL